MAKTEEEKRISHNLATAKFRKEKTIPLRVTLNKNVDADIISQLGVVRLAGKESVPAYIKRLIREDLDR